MKTLFLTTILIIATSCNQDEDPNCFQCKTEVYVNGLRQETREKSNLYCNMEYQTAYHMERINNLSYYDESGNLIETKANCNRIANR